MAATIIDKSYEDNESLRLYLAERNEISLLRTVDDSFRKTLVLSAASLFEHQITDALHNYCVHKTGSDACVLALVRIKVLTRQYHTYFEWESRGGAGPFFKLLGEEMGQRLKAQSKLEPLKISRLRHSLSWGLCETALSAGILPRICLRKDRRGSVRPIPTGFASS